VFLDQGETLRPMPPVNQPLPFGWLTANAEPAGAPDSPRNVSFKPQSAPMAKATANTRAISVSCALPPNIALAVLFRSLV
jgi:hypothetical protein